MIPLAADDPGPHSWLAEILEFILRIERRMTVLEMTVKEHGEALEHFSASEKMVKDAVWRLMTGTLAFLLGLALDQGLNGGALWLAVLALFKH